MSKQTNDDEVKKLYYKMKEAVIETGLNQHQIRKACDDAEIDHRITRHGRMRMITAHGIDQLKTIKFLTTVRMMHWKAAMLHLNVYGFMNHVEIEKETSRINAKKK